MRNYEYVLNNLKEDLRLAKEFEQDLEKTDEGSEEHIEARGYTRGLEWSVKNLELNYQHDRL